MTKPLQTTFQRIETKYLISKELYQTLLAAFEPHLVADAYAHSSISNVYFDSSDFQMIQDSVDRLHGREKVRMRTYDKAPHQDSEVFLEIKKKEGEFGKKYRMTASVKAVEDLVVSGLVADGVADERVERVVTEVNALQDRYGQLLPKMYIAYKRYSLAGIADKKVRVTFDTDVICRPHQVSLTDGRYGFPLVSQDQVIMEIKVPGVCPAWLQDILDEHGLADQPFSKYVTAYALTQAQEEVAS